MTVFFVCFMILDLKFCTHVIKLTVQLTH